MRSSASILIRRAALLAVLVLTACHVRAEAGAAAGGWVETVQVRGRLGAGSPLRAAASSVEVHSGDEIRASGARSLPEFLARLAAIDVADETGNGRNLGLDLRGFAGGTGATALLVDGVRMNEPDTNVAIFELIPLEEIERVEITKGPRGATIGGGSLAGVIHVVRKRGAKAFAGEVDASAGDFATRSLRAAFGFPAASWRLQASASQSLSDGYRDGANMRETAARFSAERDAGNVVLGMSWSHLDGDWRQPGALTEAEWEDDPARSSDNFLDRATSVGDLVSVHAEGSEPGAVTTWVAVAAFRTRRGETLTTGRSHYGFLTQSRVTAASATLEAVTTPRALPRIHVRWGAELSDERLSPEGFATDSVEDGSVDSLEAWSDIDVDWRKAAGFAGLESELPRGWFMEAGLRHDLARIERQGEELSFDTLRLEKVEGNRSFSRTELSAAIGRASQAGAFASRWRVAWADSFQPPSSIQLFAYPGYGSNESLEPQVGQGLILAGSLESERFSLEGELFTTTVKDEIVFDDATRTNRNAAKTLRRGLDLCVRGRPHDKVRLSLNAVRTLAEFSAKWGGATGASKGDHVPLVPSHRVSLLLDLGPWSGTTLSLSVRNTGDATLGSDFDNSSQPLPAYTVTGFMLRHGWKAGRATLEASLTADNLLDVSHATRGIEVGDLAGPPTLYYTPAAPRCVIAAFTASF